MLRKTSILAAVFTLALFANHPLSAQNGEPIISTGTSTSPSPSYIDAYVATGGSTGGTDLCLRIQSIYNNNTLIPAGGSATVDARGFTNTNAPSGGWACTVDPFAVTSSTTNLVGKTGMLLLGYIDIQAKVTWVIPSHIIIQGIGTNGTGTIAGPPPTVNTQIHAVTGFAAWSGSGNPAVPAILQMGLGGTNTMTLQPQSYGIQVRDLAVDCNDIASVGVFNNNSQEGSLLNNVQIFNCPSVGLHVTTNNPYSTGVGAVNSGPYKDVFISYNTTCSSCGGTSSYALEVDGDTGAGGSSVEGRSIRGFDNITVSGFDLGTKGTLIYIYGVSTEITNSHVEFCASACIEIGQAGTITTQGVRLSNITVGVNNGGYDVDIAAGTSNVIIENLNHETTGNTNTLRDNVTSNTVNDTYLGWYFLGAGASPAVFTSSNGTITDSLSVAGNVNVGGTLAKHSGTFKIDHPLDPANEYLYHSFVESPDMMNVYNGSVTTDRHGLATITLPAYFEALNRDFRYQLTPVGQFAQAMVAEKVKGNRFVIKTNKPGVEVSWQVTGIRHDDWANQHRIRVEEPKPELLRQH